ncbi:MAG: hypothetical protein ACK4MQ_00175 [Hyphomonas sp.]
MLKWGRGERSAISPKRVFHEGPAQAPVKLTADHYRQMAEALAIKPQQVRAIPRG